MANNAPFHFGQANNNNNDDDAAALAIPQNLGQDVDQIFHMIQQVKKRMQALVQDGTATEEKVRLLQEQIAQLNQHLNVLGGQHRQMSSDLDRLNDHLVVLGPGNYASPDFGRGPNGQGVEQRLPNDDYTMVTAMLPKRAAVVAPIAVIRTAIKAASPNEAMKLTISELRGRLDILGRSGFNEHQYHQAPSPWQGFRWSQVNENLFTDDNRDIEEHRRRFFSVMFHLLYPREMYYNNPAIEMQNANLQEWENAASRDPGYGIQNLPRIHLV